MTEVLTALVDGQAPANKTVVIANGTLMPLGPYGTANYNDGNGFANVTFSNVTNVTILAANLTTNLG